MTAPDVTTAVERVSRWANYLYTTPDQIAVKSQVSTFTAGDLRTILSELDRLSAALGEAMSVVTLADELINGGGLVNRGVDRGLVVVEKRDRSDPHYRLCTALERPAIRTALQQEEARDGRE